MAAFDFNEFYNNLLQADQSSSPSASASSSSHAPPSSPFAPSSASKTPTSPFSKDSSTSYGSTSPVSTTSPFTPILSPVLSPSNASTTSNSDPIKLISSQSNVPQITLAVNRPFSPLSVASPSTTAQSSFSPNPQTKPQAQTPPATVLTPKQSLSFAPRSSSSLPTTPTTQTTQTNARSRPQSKSINLYANMPLKPALILGLQEGGYQYCAPVQIECIPRVLDGQNVVCRSAPGSGKTLIFIVSILQKLRDIPQVQAIVIAHTPELVTQIHDEFIKVGKHLDYMRALAFHEHSIGNRSGCNIAIGTAAKILQFMRRQEVAAGCIFALDEADRLQYKEEEDCIREVS